MQQQEVAARQKAKQQRVQQLDQQTPTLPGEDAASLVRVFAYIIIVSGYYIIINYVSENNLFYA